jgi:hypothetical protein
MLSGVFRLSGFDAAAHDWLRRWVKASTAHSEQMCPQYPNDRTKCCNAVGFQPWGDAVEKDFGGSLSNIDSK